MCRPAFGPGVGWNTSPSGYWVKSRRHCTWPGLSIAGCVEHSSIWGCADKSSAQPGRKQATVTKLEIYSTYSPRSSIHLACCSNFCKPLKKIQKFVRPTRTSRQQWPPHWTKNGDLSFFSSVQGTGGSPAGPDLENKVGNQDIRSPGRPVSSGLQVPGEPGHCRARTRPPWWPSLGMFPSEWPSFAPAEMSNTPCWEFGPLEDNQWGGCRLDPKKSRRELSQLIFALGIFGGGVSRYATTPLIVATGSHLDRTKKFQKLRRWLAPLTFLFCVETFWGPLCGELLRVHIFMNDGPNLLTWDAQLLSYWFSQNPAVLQDQLVNLINNLQGCHGFGLSRTRHVTGGKITTFKLGHPVLDGGIQRCIFP